MLKKILNSILFLIALLSSLYLFRFITNSPTRIIAIFNKAGILKSNISSLNRVTSYTLSRITHFGNIEELCKSNNRFLILGSSEMYSERPRTGLSGREFDRYHVNFFFIDSQLGKYPVLYGEGGCQSIIHLLYLNRFDEIPVNKVVIIVSPQWFTGFGIDHQFFNAHLLNYNLFYDFYFKNNLSNEINLHVRERLNQLTSFAIFEKDPLLYLAIKATSSEKKYFIPLRYITIPFLWLRYQLNLFFGDLKKRVLLVSNIYFQISDLSNITKVKNKNSSNRMYELDPYLWDNLELEAIKHGNNLATNNPFGIYNSYYDEFIRNLKPFPIKRKMLSLESPEWNDFSALIKYLKSKGIRPLVLVPPIHAQFYNYMNYDLSNIEEFYEKMSTFLTIHEIPFETYEEYNHQKYFLNDVMHVGWLGWVKIDKRILEYLKDE